MRRYDDIMQNTKSPGTITSIADNLRKLGIVNGDILLVHSSLTSMGFVVGGAEAVVWALLQALIGVGYNVCSCLHMSETLSGVIPNDENGCAVINKDGKRSGLCITI